MKSSVFVPAALSSTFVSSTFVSSTFASSTFASSSFFSSSFASSSFASSSFASSSFVSAGFVSSSSVSAGFAPAPPRPASPARLQARLPENATASVAPLLLRAARGESVERPPVWLMRQAGRYMAAFREYSTRHPFRHRSETPAIACELSLQPWRTFDVDAVIFFSDILTPLPAAGMQFDILPGKGPLFDSPLRTELDVQQFIANGFHPHTLAFVPEILSTLRKHIQNDTALLGFVGAPFTLASYMIEGSSVKNLLNVKRFMYTSSQKSFHQLLQHLAQIVADYAVFQIQAGAQAIQLFDSWAHHLSPDQYKTFAIPYAKQALLDVKRRCPDVPLFFFANGLSGKVHDVCTEFHGVADVLSVDWSVRLSDVREAWPGVLQGNIDPAILAVGDSQAISQAVSDTVRQNGGMQNLIINLGHGVVQQTPEASVQTLVDCVKQLAQLPAPSAS